MRNNSHVIFLTQLFYPEMVSTGQTMTELAEELVRQGVTVDVICGPPTVSDQPTKINKKLTHNGVLHNGVRIRRVWGTQFPKLNICGKLINQLTFTFGVIIFLLTHRVHSPILVNTNPPFLAWICALLRRLGGPHFIYLVFDVYPETAIVCGVLSQNGFISKLWRQMNRFTYSHAQSVVVIGRCMKKRLLPYFSPSQKDKLVHTHIWADDTLLSADTTDTFRLEWGLTDQFIVLYSGNMGRFHDMQTIMAAATQLRAMPMIQFVFVGEGTQKQWCHAYVTENNLNNCHFYPYVDKSDLPKLLATANVGLVSLNKGQWGLSVPSKTMGIMAANRPVIGILPSQSEIAYLISENHCGIVVPNGNTTVLTQSITRLYDSPKTAKKMGENGRQFITSTHTLFHTGRFFKTII
jgi:glycosyltransferase involved in cell wall biosynthesis